MQLKDRSREKGFTLIELIVVLVILATLAAVAIPRFVNMTNEARLANEKDVARSLQAWVAMQAAKLTAQSPPTSGTNLTYPAANQIVDLSTFMDSAAAAQHSGWTYAAATGTLTAPSGNLVVYNATTGIVTGPTAPAPPP